MNPRITTNQPRVSAPLQALNDFDGVLVIDKPSGPTSHDIVDIIRKQFGFRKVGHGGTLDPQATGLLLILIGKGTKLSERIMGSDKEYEGAMKLGVATATQDAQGEIIRESDCSFVTRDQVEAQMAGLTGDIQQLPPMVSAVKVDGVPLYKHARKGRTIERKSRLVHVYEFKMKDFDLPLASFFIRCTKGTYVRTLCADIGEALGCGAHLEQLRRTRSGSVSIEEAVQLDKVQNMKHEELAGCIIPLSVFIASKI